MVLFLFIYFKIFFIMYIIHFNKNINIFRDKILDNFHNFFKLYQNLIKIRFGRFCKNAFNFIKNKTRIKLSTSKKFLK